MDSDNFLRAVVVGSIAAGILCIGLSKVSKIKVSNVFNGAGKRVFMQYSKLVTNYKWKYRKYLPSYLMKLSDKILSIETQSATVNCPRDITESVTITEAILTKHDMCIDVTNDMSEWTKQIDKSGYITIYMDELVPISFQNTSDNSLWELEVSYLGHSDPIKKIEAQQFCVKYECHGGDNGIVFPPYSASEKIKKGLGLPKITKAMNEQGNMLSEAYRYAGLRKNFYKDCENDFIVKPYIGSLHDTYVEISHKGSVEVLVIN